MSYVLTVETYTFTLIGESIIFVWKLVKKHIAIKIIYFFSNLTYAYLMATVSAFTLNYRHP